MLAGASLPPALQNPAPNSARGSRWSGSAWLFYRDDSNAGALAPGGTLGGSQAGMRLNYRINGDARKPLSVSARFYSPLGAAQTALGGLRGLEAALGVDWRPIASLPVNVLLERRQALGNGGRSDFSLMLHGGFDRRLANGRVRIEGYGQAGVVGLEERDLFADGGITATTRLGPFAVGGGAWGGAQPGAARLDVGPHIGLQLPLGRVVLRGAAEWRFRVAGDAAPDSGPALTLSAGF